MTLYMYDAAYKPNLDQVVAHGGIAMSVYLTGSYANTCAQPSELHAKKLGALGNYEQAPDELLHCGKSGGVDIGKRAAAAYVAKGAPADKNLVIAYSVDVDAPPSSFPAIAEAFDGIRIGAATVGQFRQKVYGEGALIDYLIAHGKVDGHVEWLSASTSFPGFDAADPNVGTVQLIGSPVPGTDEDRITSTEWLDGIWWPAGSPYDKGDNPMADLTKEQLDEIADAVWERRIKDGEVDWEAASYLTGARNQALAAARTLTAANGALARITALQKDMAALKAAVANVSAAGLDEDALVDKIIAKLAAHLATATPPPTA